VIIGNATEVHGEGFKKLSSISRTDAIICKISKNIINILQERPIILSKFYNIQQYYVKYAQEGLTTWSKQKICA
jgi:hypothetical protein